MTPEEVLMFINFWINIYQLQSEIRTVLNPNVAQGQSHEISPIYPHVCLWQVGVFVLTAAISPRIHTDASARWRGRELWPSMASSKVSVASTRAFRHSWQLWHYCQLHGPLLNPSVFHSTCERSTKPGLCNANGLSVSQSSKLQQ